MQFINAANDRHFYIQGQMKDKNKTAYRRPNFSSKYLSIYFLSF